MSIHPSTTVRHFKTEPQNSVFTELYQPVNLTLKFACFVTAHYNSVLVLYRFVLLYNDVGQFQDAVKLGITTRWVPEQK
jgi:hypothetical protein